MNLRHGLGALMVLSVLLMMAGCGQSDNAADQVTADDVKEEMAEAADAAASMTQQEMADFASLMESQLDSVKEDVDALQTRADVLQGKAKTLAQQKIDALEKERKEAAAKLKQFKSAGSDAWEDLKLGLQSAMFQVNRALDDAAAEFK